MSIQVIEGNWDDLIARQDLHGRRVRVIVLEESSEPVRAPGQNAWLKSLRAWTDSHEALGHIVDDSREDIYSGTVDDPR